MASDHAPGSRFLPDVRKAALHRLTDEGRLANGPNSFGAHEDGDVARSVRLVVFDFDGVFTDNTVWTDDAGNEWVRSWRGDGLHPR